MAGRGQHFIPRHFLKPFVSPNGRDIIWLYRRDSKEPVPVPRGDVAKQRDFYSKPRQDGLPSLDDLITDYETKISELVDKLRELPVGSSAPAKNVAEVAAHLSVRSAHMRVLMLESANGFVNSLAELIQNPDSLLPMRQLSRNKPPRRIEDLLLEAIAEQEVEKISGIRADAIVRILYFFMREQGPHMLSAVCELLLPMIKNLGHSSKEIISQAHVDTLAESLAPEKLVEKLSGLNWTVVAKKGTPAILPDCVCISRTMDRWHMLFPFFSEECELVVLPLTPDKLIVGCAGEFSLSELGDYNRAASSVCMQFFLSKDRHPELDNLHEKLGDQLRRKVNHLIKKSIREGIKEFVVQPPTAAFRFQTEAAQTAQAPLAFQLRLREFGDESFARELGKTIQKIIIETMPPESFPRIDGFTFAVDYESALREIDRGFKPQNPIRTTSDNQRIRVAMPLTVRREDAIKTHVVLRSYLAEQLLSEDECDLKNSRQILTYVLAGICLQDLIGRKFPNVMLTRIQDPIEEFLHQAAGNVFSSYFSSRSTIPDVDTFVSHQEILIEQIEEARSEIVLRRRKYRTAEDDLGSFLDYTMATLEHVLNSSARVLGMRHAMGEDIDMSSKLAALLEDMEMLEWFELFGEDLDAFFCGLNEWSKFEDLFFINRHLERWLVFFGIIVDQTDDNEVYVHVPLVSDADYLLSIS